MQFNADLLPLHSNTNEAPPPLHGERLWKNYMYDRKRRISVLCQAALFLGLLVACGSEEVIDNVVTESEDPMRFGSATMGVETKSGLRAAGDKLKHGFVVSSYKLPTTGGMQTVMERYEAVYKESPWYQNSSWGTVGGIPDFYQEQVERYWDYSARSYQFHAVAPNSNKRAAEYVTNPDFTLTATELRLPGPFQRQTAADGAVTPEISESEPYLVAQVERHLQGAASATDYDMLVKDPSDATKALVINAEKGTSSGRTVALPFHHLTSRVRFAIYTTVSNCPASLFIHNVTISASSASGFITRAESYEATLASGKNFMQGDFESPAREWANVETTLLTLLTGGTTSTAFPEAYLDQHVGKDKAYFFECKDGLMQLPQTGVKLSVDLRIGSHRYTFPLKVGSEDTFTWEPNKLYTYYIVVSNIDPFMIHFTASLTDWEDVKGSFSVDLED